MRPNNVSSKPTSSLLAADDPLPVQVINPGGGSSFLLLGDHAGNTIPASLGALGLSRPDLTRHIAWDIGIAALGVALAEALDAAFIRQTYSRLVIDCNRDPGAIDAIPEVSDGTRIAGNQALSAADRQARVAAIHDPYQRAIAAELDARDARGAKTALVSLHSFTPVMGPRARPWQIGVLYDGGAPGFARRILGGLRDRAGLVVGDNEPYRMDLIDYTIPRHAYPEMRDYVEIEIRQDLLTTAEMIEGWTRLLASVLIGASAIPPDNGGDGY